jgi:hypothetical protein
VAGVAWDSKTGKLGQLEVSPQFTLSGTLHLKTESTQVFLFSTDLFMDSESYNISDIIMSSILEH